VYQLIVDAILGLHLAYIVFVLFGGLLVLRHPRLAWLHLPAVVWGAIVEFMDWPCPLTTWENHFRDLAGASAYHGDFVWHYLLRIIYPAGLTTDVHLLLGGIVVVLNLAIYAVIFMRAKR
jgi:DMSO/TMAO reductase YedYZ heme-binding membrane subunit